MPAIFDNAFYRFFSLLGGLVGGFALFRLVTIMNITGVVETVINVVATVAVALFAAALLVEGLRVLFFSRRPGS